MNKRKYVIGIGIIVLALGFLIFQGLDSSMMAYLNVREIGQSSLVSPQSVVQVTGIVRPGSLETTSGTRQVKFLLQDLESIDTVIPVTYQGLLPDNFKPGLQVLVQGKVNEMRSEIQAQQILAKCPSKYDASIEE